MGWSWDSLCDTCVVFYVISHKMLWSITQPSHDHHTAVTWLCQSFRANIKTLHCVPRPRTLVSFVTGIFVQFYSRNVKKYGMKNGNISYPKNTSRKSRSRRLPLLRFGNPGVPSVFLCLSSFGSVSNRLVAENAYLALGLLPMCHALTSDLFFVGLHPESISNVKRNHVFGISRPFAMERSNLILAEASVCLEKHPISFRLW